MRRKEAPLANEHKFTSARAWPRGQRERLWLFSRGREAAVSDPPPPLLHHHHPNHHHLPSDPEAAERREDVGSSHLSPESKNTTERVSVFAPRAFCGCFIAGQLSHKCHTNLDRSHLMSEEAAEVRNRRLFAHCCRRVSPRVWSLHSAGPVARRSRGFLGESTPPEPKARPKERTTLKTP